MPPLFRMSPAGVIFADPEEGIKYLKSRLKYYKALYRAARTQDAASRNKPLAQGKPARSRAKGKPPARGRKARTGSKPK